ncbi:MAG TPA: hypothetical protein VLX59_18075 [Acidimicrobiales bacterium]|nr:hypothetical protein [Acidimicrobiales bacterium]
MTDSPDPHSRFWQLAEPLLAIPGVSRSTMLGFPCLRLHGDFFASWDPHAKQLVIKLDSSDVETLIHTGGGLPFAPAGRRFREWVAVPATGRARWPVLLEHAYRHAVRRQVDPPPAHRKPRPGGRSTGSSSSPGG